ncbi:MAG: hypothetical protein ACYCY1_09990 [Sulfuriferula sp.]
MTWKLILAATFIFLTCFLISWYSIRQLREKNGRDIRIVWYFFSLSWVATYGIAWWAVSKGALHQQGFQGGLGELLKKLLGIMLDLNADLIVLLAIVAIITLPQLIGYVLSGLSGCASAPFLIEGSLSFLVWGLIKSFSVCAGIILSLAVFSMWQGWHTWWQGGFVMTYTSSLLLMFSFAVLLMYREAESVASDFRKYFPKTHKVCLTVHKWFTRHTLPR